MLRDLANTEFLDEPAYRWFVAVGALGLFIYVWRGAVDYMK